MATHTPRDELWHTRQKLALRVPLLVSLEHFENLLGQQQHPDLCSLHAAVAVREQYHNPTQRRSQSTQITSYATAGVLRRVHVRVCSQAVRVLLALTRCLRAKLPIDDALSLMPHFGTLLDAEDD